MLSGAHLPKRSVLYVKVIKACKLKAADPNGKSDPYCIISLDGFGSEFQTKVCPATLDPEWNEAFSFIVDAPQSIALGNEGIFAAYLKVDVWDHDRFNAADFLGRAVIPLATIGEDMKEVCAPLGRSVAKDKISGKITLGLQFSYRQDKLDMSTPTSSPVPSVINPEISANFSLPRGPIDKRKNQAIELNTDLYELTSTLGFHLPILCGKTLEEIPGKTEKVEFCISNVIVQMGSAKCIGQVYITNYRLVIFALPGRGNWLRYEETQDLTTYVPLSAIKSVEKNQDERRIHRISGEGAKNTDTVTVTLNCHDARRLTLVFIRGTHPFLQRLTSGAKHKQDGGIQSTLQEETEGLSNPGDSNKVGLLKSHQTNCGDGKLDNGNSFEDEETLGSERSGFIDEPGVKMSKSSSFTGNILVDELSRLEKSFEDDFLEISQDVWSIEPESQSKSNPGPSDVKSTKKTSPPVTVSYSKLEQNNTDAIYNTEIDKVLLRAGVKHASGMNVHQKLANALYLKLEHHILNQSEQTTAYIYSEDNTHLHLGFWDIYNFPREMRRQEISDKWYLSAINGPQYHICSTYPALLYFPSESSKDVIEGSAEFRSRGRLPTLVWTSKKNGCWMMRSAQPLTGANYKRSQEDETLLEDALSLAPPNSDMVIFDARSFIAAGGNRFKGKGTEVPTNYKRCRLVYLDIPNIHAVRDSEDKLLDVCLSSENDKWLSLVESTSWLNYISLILKGSALITRYMTERKCCALVHCSDGWDRTSQLCSLSQLMMDPYYRTVEGFAILIEKEWISFGHKFRHRLGHPNYPNERSPVFLQFLDCVYQILEQNQSEFEFTSMLLLRIADHLHSEWFGTFITDSEMEKNEGGIMAQTVSLWAHIMAIKDKLVNPNYNPNPEQEVIVVEHNIRRLRLWQEYFLRYDSTSTLQNVETEEVKDFEDRERLLTQPQDMVVWVADKKATECKGCGQKFSYLIRRKHHCRACGQIFCNDCTKGRMTLPNFGYDEDVRVCDRCYQKHNELTEETRDSE